MTRSVCRVSSDKICGAGQAVYYNNLVHCDKEYCLPRTTLSVVSNTTYLLHIANGGVSAMLNTAIEGHTMTVVEVDGIPCKLQEVVFLDLHVGQRVGVLITTDKPEGAYWISSIVRGRQTDPVRTGGAFLIYNNEEHNLDGQAGEDDPARLALIESQPEWDDWEFMRLQQQLFESLVPETMPTLEDVDRTFVFLNTQERFEPHHVNNSPTGGDVSGIGIGDNLQERPQCKCDSSDGFLKWAVDRKSFVNPTTPLLHSMFFETNEKSEKELEDEGFYKLYESEVYDIVLQNFPACNGACEVHPWHLHGHHFWHVGTFEGAYDPSVGYPEEEAGNNYKRDTILLVGADKQNTDATCSELREPCGNAVIRFEADNPGAWFFHCHIDWHLVMGMAVAFYYDDIPYTAPEPDLSVYDICGDIYPQVVVDRVLGMKKSKTTGKGKQQSKTTGKGKKKSKAKGEDKKKPGKKKINRKGEEKQGQRPTSYPEEG